MGVAASSFLAGCSAPTSSSNSQEWDQEADVVVVGAGGAGLAAAIEAANAGASVLLLEKASAVGGDSALSDGILGGWGTKLAKEQGIDADADDVYRWFTRHPEWYGPKDPAIARVLADKSGETIDWLQEMGVPFLKEVGPLFGYTELPVIHHVDGKGAEMVRVLAETAKKPRGHAHRHLGNEAGRRRRRTRHRRGGRFRRRTPCASRRTKAWSWQRAASPEARP